MDMGENEMGATWICARTKRGQINNLQQRIATIVYFWPITDIHVDQIELKRPTVAVKIFIAVPLLPQ